MTDANDWSIEISEPRANSQGNNATPYTVGTAELQPNRNHWQIECWQCYKHPGSCVQTFLVPCYTAGTNAERVARSFWLHSFMCFVPFVGCFCSARVRTDLRRRDNIPGATWVDYLLHYTCPWCALTQEDVHLRCVMKTVDNDIVIVAQPQPQPHQTVENDFSSIQSPPSAGKTQQTKAEERVKEWTTFEEDANHTNPTVAGVYDFTVSPSGASTS